MHHALDHLQQRKNPQPYPHPNPRVRLLDGSIYVLGVIGPLFTIPQLYGIWVNHDVAGISLFYWIAQTIGSGVWWAYGAVHHERPIILSSALWFFSNVLVALGVAIYS